MPRPRATVLLCVPADVLTAVFWPGPLDGLTVAFIVAVDVTLAFALLGLPPLIRAHRSISLLQADALAGAPIRYWHPKPPIMPDPIDVANAAQVQL